MSTTPVIRIEDLSKRFVIRKEKSLKERLLNFGRSNLHKEDFWALRDVDLEIEAGTTVGLVGPNGSGKSTLLKTIGGIIQPTTGSVLLRGRLAALLELGAGFHPDLTGRENVYLNASILGLSRQTTDRYFDAIVEFSGIERFIDTQVKFYSSGMYVRLAFAVAVHVDPDILLVDEVLAVGDEPFQRKCLERIRTFQKEGRTIILVSHGLDQVAEFCDRAVVLENGRVAADGAPEDALMVLRADFEVARQADLARLAAASPQDAAAAARFTGISVRSDDSEGGRPVVDEGETITIAMEVRSDAELRDWSIEVGIATPLGNPLFVTTTEMLGIDLAPLQGTRQFTLTLPEVHLGSGDYAVRTTLRSGDGAEIHYVPVGAQFSVRTAGSSRGHVFMPAIFEAH
ncbi:ABC transporter ATP-binding protein [Cellulomonas humilata]|uniref:ABC-2 type transport system ATP-binding protein n=1 Tax=Cellulomonas humilata TaxID=144055 RepID=A0ABU0EEH5_9CELL|nr:ABC transporter ATP-binding protein [Cellulomonas humilata]MDQ0373237.1 ABC-2 type transport system ATP-binding protein [Cellulomonas humilata]